MQIKLILVEDIRLQSVQKVLPTGYQYSCHEFREIPSQNFTGAPQENFYVKLSVSNIITKEDVNQWLQQFQHLQILNTMHRVVTNERG